MSKYQLGKGNVSLTSQPNIEYSNPIIVDMDMRYRTNRNLIFSIGNAIGEADKHLSTLEKLSFEKFSESWSESVKEIMAIEFPIGFFDFLNCRKKKRQEAILKKHDFSLNSLTALIYKAFKTMTFYIAIIDMKKNLK